MNLAGETPRTESWTWTSTDGLSTTIPPSFPPLKKVSEDPMLSLCDGQSDSGDKFLRGLGTKQLLISRHMRFLSWINSEERLTRRLLWEERLWSEILCRNVNRSRVWVFISTDSYLILVLSRPLTNEINSSHETRNFTTQTQTQQSNSGTLSPQTVEKSDGIYSKNT